MSRSISTLSSALTLASLALSQGVDRHITVKTYTFGDCLPENQHMDTSVYWPIDDFKGYEYRCINVLNVGSVYYDCPCKTCYGTAFTGFNCQGKQVGNVKSGECANVLFASLEVKCGMHGHCICQTNGPKPCWSSGNPPDE